MTASYRSPKTEVRGDSIAGRGVFAIAPIARDEIVAIKGGHLVDRKTLEERRDVVGDSELQIAEGLYLVPLSSEEHDAVMMFLNHSCEPNAGVMGNIVFVAMRDIATGEEVTIDYAMIDDHDFAMTCSCGSTTCRGTVTGRDWQRPELQSRYRGFFSAFLARKIEQAR
jgi:SET domain-containing protein